MDRRQNLLKAKALPNLPCGWHSDGGGLYLVVSDKGHRAWIRRATVPGTKKRQEDKLGDYPEMTLDEARRERDRRRDDARAAHIANVMPPAPKVDRDKTVKAVAELWIDNCIGTGRWKSLTHPGLVRQQLRDYVYPLIGHRPIALLTHDHVCEVLDQQGGKDDPRTFWLRYPTLADKVRRLLADIVNFASAKGYRSRDLANPAAWDRLQYLYSATTTIHTVTHHAAIEPEDAPALMAKIKSDKQIPAKALAYVLLTSVRIGDVFGGGREKSQPFKWKHLDAAKRNWHVPETKKSKPLTVPLSDQAFAIIQEMKALQGGHPSPEAKVFPRSKRQLGFALVRAGMAGKQTVHGCRSLFYTWAKNIDDDGEPLKRDLISAALCHKSETEMDEVYNRGTYLEKRWLLMQRWADYLDGKPKGDIDSARPRLRVV
jgi:hypothetical protein